MSQPEIAELARAVSQEQFLSNWLYQLVFLALVFLVTAAGAYIGSYLRRRGETRAITVDLEKIRQHVEITERTSQAIRIEMAQLDWRRREIETLRRAKLESMFDAILESAEWNLSLVDLREKDFTGREKMTELLIERAPYERACMIGLLYFPDCEAELLELWSCGKRVRLSAANHIVAKKQAWIKATTGLDKSSAGEPSEPEVENEFMFNVKAMDRAVMEARNRAILLMRELTLLSDKTA